MGVALVTGAGGFIGAHLAAALSDAGRRVRALQHSSPVSADERVTGSLGDPGARREAVAGVETVFHCAAVLEPDSESADEVNHYATIALAHDAAEAGVRRFVFVSSRAAIGNEGAAGPLREDAPCTPSTSYGKSKLAAERGLAALGARITIVRPPVVYGPGEQRVFLSLTRAVARGVFPVLGGGRNRQSFCHVENLVSALLFLEARELDGLYHVADARPVELREVVHTIARALGRRLVLARVPRPLASAGARVLGDTARSHLAWLGSDRPLDTSRIEALGFTPNVELDEGVRETIDSYRSRGLS